MVVVQKVVGRPSKDAISGVEGLDRGKAAMGIGAVLLPARIGRSDVCRQASSLEKVGKGKLPLHLGGVPPGPIDEEDSQLAVGGGEWRSVHAEEDIVGKIGENSEWISEKSKIGAPFQPAQGALFQIFPSVAQNNCGRKCKHFLYRRVDR